MAIDRAGALRNAEKFLRQGKFDLAIAEYRLVIQDQPLDWNTANLLGDLYARVGLTEKAVEQFTRVADGFRQNGFLSKAGALYKKILRLSPGDEHALLQAAEMAAGQGLLVDARSHLRALADRRRARGDTRGADDVAVRLVGLDAVDAGARASSVRARLTQGDARDAEPVVEDLAAALALESQDDQAIELLREAGPLDRSRPVPNDAQSSFVDSEPHVVETLGQAPVDDPESARPAILASIAPEVERRSTAAVVKSSPVALAQPRTETNLVDLSVGLEGIERPSHSVDIDDVFARLRHEASRSSTDAAEQEFRRGMTLYEAGRVDDSVAPLLVASRTPRFRLEAALTVGRIFRGRSQVSQAIEWFERGAEAPAATPDLRHQVLFELADALGSIGETARALAVYLELQADAGEFRDTAGRIERLLKAQARG